MRSVSVSVTSRLGLAAVWALAAAGCAAPPYWAPVGRVPEIAAAPLSARLAGPAPPLLLDVRTDGEWGRGHIEGALHVPITALAARLGMMTLPRDRPVVAICYSGHRSIVAVRMLQRAGYPAAQQLQGGMLAWRAAGLPEVKAPPPARATYRPDATGRVLDR